MSTSIDTPIPAAPAAPAPATPARRRRFAPVAFGILVIAVFFGGIGIAYAGGAWQTTGQTTVDGRPSLQGESATEVKGWMPVGDVAQIFGVPLDVLLAAFELPAETNPATALKDLESDLFSVSALREWLDAEGYAAP